MFFLLGRKFLTFYFKESPEIVWGGGPHTNQDATLYEMENTKFMFETTNQNICICKKGEKMTQEVLF